MEEVTTGHPTTELPELTQDWEIDSWRTQENPVHQDPEERSSDPEETALDLPVGVLESTAEAWVSGAGLGALRVAVHAWDLLREVIITFTIVWPQVNNRDRTQSHPSTENWIKIY